MPVSVELQVVLVLLAEHSEVHDGALVMVGLRRIPVRERHLRTVRPLPRVAVVVVLPMETDSEPSMASGGNSGGILGKC